MTLIDIMADQHPPQTAKDSKRFFNRVKKMFRRGSQSMPPALVTPPAVVASPPTVAAPSAVALSPADPLPPANLAPTVSTDLEEAAKLRAKYTHFHILIIGRANAGKTTLLQRVCNTTEDPVYTKVGSPSLDTPTLIVPSPTD